MVFEDYAKYYDLLYRDKDYSQEIEYIIGLIKRFSNGNHKNILDIGCGTGRHARFLSARGYNVTGIDFSHDMIEIANNNKPPNTDFTVSNATSFNFDRKFDVILSLFHVVSYQTKNDEILKMFNNVYRHLADGGIFIFDFWYGPAVFHEKPSVRIKRLEDNDLKIVRIAEPEMVLISNLVKVHYDLHIFNKKKTKTNNIKEIHCMRYFFIPEICSYLSSSNLKEISFEEWLTGSTPSQNTWGVCCVAEKNGKH